MKYFFKLTFIILLFLSCKSESNDEKAVKEVVNSFFQYVNQRDFKMLETICTVKMKKHVEQFKSFGDDLVKYKKFEIKSMNIVGNTASVNMINTDQFDNEIESTWKLVKTKGSWKMDLFKTFVIDEAEPFADEKIYMPEKDPNIIPYSQADSVF